MCPNVYILSEPFKRHLFAQGYGEQLRPQPLVHCDMANLDGKVFFLWCALLEHNPLAFLTKFARICDTVHIAIVTHSVYFYAVTNFSNPLALGDATVYVFRSSLSR